MSNKLLKLDNSKCVFISPIKAAEYRLFAMTSGIKTVQESMITSNAETVDITYSHFTAATQNMSHLLDKIPIHSPILPFAYLEAIFE